MWEPFEPAVRLPRWALDSVVLWFRDVWSHRRDGGGTERWTPVSQVHLVQKASRVRISALSFGSLKARCSSLGPFSSPRGRAC